MIDGVFAVLLAVLFVVVWGWYMPRREQEARRASWRELEQLRERQAVRRLCPVRRTPRW